MISFLVITARPEYGAYSPWGKLDGYPDTVHLFEPWVKTLYPQLTEKVELVIADNLADHRNLTRFFEDYPLIECKVIPQGTHWQAMGCGSHAEPYNNAIRRSSGDYLVFLTDCVSFPPNFFERLKTKKDLVAQFLWHEKIDDYLMPKEGFEKKFTHPDEANMDELVVSDNRWLLHPWGDKTVLSTFWECPWQMCYGFFGAPRKVIYEFNGLDENFDGQKELNDVELFSRMQFRDPDMPITWDKDLFVYHHRHGPVLDSQGKQSHNRKAVRSNLDMIHFHRSRQIWKANSIVWAADDLKPVVDGSLLGYLGVQMHARNRDKELTDYWLHNQPCKNL